MSLKHKFRLVKQSVIHNPLVSQRFFWNVREPDGYFKTCVRAPEPVNVPEIRRCSLLIVNNLKCVTNQVPKHLAQRGYFESIFIIVNNTPMLILEYLRWISNKQGLGCFLL